MIQHYDFNELLDFATVLDLFINCTFKWALWFSRQRLSHKEWPLGVRQVVTAIHGRLPAVAVGTFFGFVRLWLFYIFYPWAFLTHLCHRLICIFFSVFTLFLHFLLCIFSPILVQECISQFLNPYNVLVGHKNILTSIILYCLILFLCMYCYNIYIYC